MYPVDTSVWVDYLHRGNTPQAATLKELLAGEEIVGVAPIILQDCGFTQRGSQATAREKSRLPRFETRENCASPSGSNPIHRLRVAAGPTCAGVS